MRIWIWEQQGRPTEFGWTCVEVFASSFDEKKTRPAKRKPAKKARPKKR